jgi:hypothetical protein
MIKFKMMLIIYKKNQFYNLMNNNKILKNVKKKHVYLIKT